MNLLPEESKKALDELFELLPDGQAKDAVAKLRRDFTATNYSRATVALLIQDEISGALKRRELNPGVKLLEKAYAPIKAAIKARK
ncbi:MAG: hypothetical protein HYY46_11900 [Deltaproteobacteria bacterium]|nr:hypothetical protein [Deltaproteobacteria bacterium]